MYTIPKYIYVMWGSLIVAGGFSIFRADWSTLLICLIVFSSTVYIVHAVKKYRMKIPSGLLTFSILFIYGTLFLGEVHNFYERFWWWDTLLHAGSAIGFGLIGVMILIIMFRRGKVKASPIVVSLFAFSFAMMVGAVWEIFEFAMDQVFGMSMQKSGLVDTMWDLIVDAGGAFLASAAGYVYLKKNKKTGLAGVVDKAVR